MSQPLLLDREIKRCEEREGEGVDTDLDIIFLIFSCSFDICLLAGFVFTDS